MSKDPEKLWSSPFAGNTTIDYYRQHVNRKYHQTLKDTKELQQWTVSKPHDFWIDVYSWLKLKPALPAGTVKAYDDTLPMSSNPPFFPGLQMNYAENALFDNPDPNATALIGVREDTDLEQTDGEVLSWRQVRERVRLAASALRNCGVKQGDRVAALVATSVWAVILFHASASIGAIFTSISPELGLEGCISRLDQVTPSILFADSDTLYKGKSTSIVTKVQEIVKRLNVKPRVYMVPVISPQEAFESTEDFLDKANSTDELAFVRVPFNYPLMICYSSGTTGAPKCIVHQHGIIIQLKKISIIHNSTTPKDVILQYSSTSWIVFYIMCGYFASGATTIVYNGSPTHPSPTHLLHLIQKFRVTYFGTSPRYLFELQTSHPLPLHKSFNLSSLRIVYVTGSTLSPTQYKWFYTSFPPRVHLCNTAGGTDIATSLIAGDPSGEIHAGEMQVFALGMDVDVADPETGESIMRTGRAGEMVVRKAFPSMPCFFWGDEGGEKYREAYFRRFERVDVWAQHDWLRWNPRTGGLVLEGRSDGVLNPSGIRFGSGEIYAIVEAKPFTEHVSNSLCVGRRRPQDRDEEVFLFLVMNTGHAFTLELVDSIRQAIRTGLSPRHVPHYILEAPEIPTTINGKKVESAVKQTLSGKDVKASNTVMNPDAISFFKQFRELERQPRAAKL